VLQQHLEHKLEVVEENYNILKKKTTKKNPISKRWSKISKKNCKSLPRYKRRSNMNETREGSYENHIAHKLEIK
jgi:hypothetical protein